MPKNIFITSYRRAGAILDAGKPKIDGIISIGSNTTAVFPTAGCILVFADVPKDWQGLKAPTETQMLRGVEYARTVKGNLLVHCAAGQSRSTGICLAYYCSTGMKAEAAVAALDEAVSNSYHRGLRKAKDDHHPNMRLVMFADKVYGYEGKLIDAYCKRYRKDLSLVDARSSFWQSVSGSDYPAILG
jgi:predicted protein tyrosine phosphatase